MKLSQLPCALTLAAVMFVGTSTPASASELLRNPSFETGGGGAGDSGTPPGEWLFLGGTPDTYSSDGSNGRPPGLGIFPAGQLAADGIRWVTAHNNGPEVIGQVLSVPLTPGEVYVLDAVILRTSVFPGTNGPGGYGVYLDNVQVGSLSTTTLVDQWEPRSLVFTAPPNANVLTTFRLIPEPSTANLSYVAIDSLSLQGRSPYDDWCNGDGGDQTGCTDCPCNNNSPVGTIGGCLNSAATSTSLFASGSASVALPIGDTTDLRFVVSGAPPNAFGVLLSDSAVGPLHVTSPCFGLMTGLQAADRDGLRCVVGGMGRRHGGRSADANGEIGVTNNGWGGEFNPPAGIAGQAAFVAGQTRFFQFNHRDNAALVCMRGLNSSQAVEVGFVP